MAVVAVLGHLGPMLAKSASHADDFARVASAGAKDVAHEASVFDDAARASGVIDDGRNLRSPVSSSTGAELANSDEFVRRRPSTHNVFIVAPQTDAEAAVIFGGGATRSRAVSEATRAKSASHVPPVDIRRSTMLKRYIRQSDDQFISIIGHNEDGAIVFPDGSKVDLSQVADDCLSYGKVCIFLSCGSEKYVGGGALSLSNKLTYRDAIEISNSLSAYLEAASAGQSSASAITRDFRTIVQGSNIGIGTADAIQISVVPAGFVGATILVVQADSDG